MNLLVSRATSAAEPLPSEIEFFESRIRPILHEHCYTCHSSEAKIVGGGLLLDTHDGLSAGGDSGPVVVPQEPDQSLLIAALRHESLQMPPDDRLSDAVISDFEYWIASGAADPRRNDPKTVKRVTARIDPDASRDHWAFQRLASPPVPRDVDPDWNDNPIDALVWDKLNKNGWRPANRADKHTLLRRATFDLTGLPPTLREIDAFITDESPTNFRRVVDRLLASPHYGQRWGRYWLDLVRYADTNGADENHQMPNAWRYRDWVIRSLNHDLPLDVFITHQLAGDLLPVPSDETQAGELLTATGMLVIGPKMLAEQDKEKMRIDIIDEQIDTVSRTMLGMTIACARCHDHKFDPISTEDYYALSGIFASTRTMENEEFVSRWLERPLPSARIDRQIAQHQDKIDAAKEQLDQLVADATQQLLKDQNLSELPEEPEKQFPSATKQSIEEAKKAIESLKKQTPKHDMAMSVESRSPTNLPVHIRGNHLTKTKTPIARGVPARLNLAAPFRKIPADQGGRLELARWFTSPDHPLTARVMANRLWMWHFGQPLMRSPSNFGLQSSRPLQNDLLDWISVELFRADWSLKRMHRLIMLSSTYQMTSQRDDYTGQDPSNDYLWRQNRRRLEVEPLRDAILCVGDSIDFRFGGTPAADDAGRGTVYLAINRAALNELFSTFDYVEPANHIEQRPVTTVPGQALYLLNSPLVHQQAAKIARNLTESIEDARPRAAQLWSRLHGCPPSDKDLRRMLRFVDDAQAYVSGDEQAKEQAAWASLCRTLIAGSQFCYVQ